MNTRHTPNDDARSKAVGDTPIEPSTLDPSGSRAQRHVVVGAGSIGSGVARRLAVAGHDVQIVTRSGSGPEHPRIQRIAADASDASRLASIAQDAHAIFNCANPTYSTWATAWPPMQAAMIAAAEASGARLVTMGNLYVYASDSSPMSATDPIDPPSTKGLIRAAMWEQALEAHRSGRIRATEVRASDFFGPGLGENGHLGDRFVTRLLAARRALIMGLPDQPHSWSYIGDVCDTLVALGNDDRSFGRAWHVPTVAPRSAIEMAHAICDAAGVERQKVTQLPGVALRLAGIFSADLRGLREMLYQFDRPFVIDATETTEVFGLRATPLDEQVEATIASYGEVQGAENRSLSAASG